MFALIITIVSIALVAVLSLATLYYGGSAWGAGASRAEAAKILNQGQQLVGAADVFFTKNRRWPNTMQELIDARLLQQVPTAGLSGLEDAVAAPTNWTMPTAGVPMFVTNTAATEVCAEVNLAASLRKKGIPRRAHMDLVAQCYGSAADSLRTVFKKAADTPMTGLPDVTTDPPPDDPTDPDWWSPPGGEPDTDPDTDPPTDPEPPTEDPPTDPTYPEPPAPPGPPGQLSFSPASLSFGTVVTGGWSELTTTLTNTGGTVVDMTHPTNGWNWSWAENDNWQFNPYACWYDTVQSGYLQPGESCTITLALSPVTEGPKTFQFTITHNGAGGTAVLNASGTTPGSSLQVLYSGRAYTGTPVDAGKMFYTSKMPGNEWPEPWRFIKGNGSDLVTFTVRNRGTTPTTLDDWEAYGEKSPDSHWRDTDPSVDPAAGGTCVRGMTLAPLATCTFNVTVTGFMDDGFYIPRTGFSIFPAVWDSNGTGAESQFDFVSGPAYELDDSMTNKYQNPASVGSSYSTHFMVLNHLSSAVPLQLTPLRSGITVNPVCGTTLPASSSCRVNLTYSVPNHSLEDYTHMGYYEWSNQTAVAAGGLGLGDVGFQAIIPAPSGGGGGGGNPGGGLGGGSTDSQDYIAQAGVNNFEVPVNTPWSGSCSGQASQYNSCAAQATRIGGGYSNCQVFSIEASWTMGPGTWQSRIHCMK